MSVCVNGMSGSVVIGSSDDKAMDNNSVTFVATRRNGRALCLNGFFYHINKSVDERSYWKCRTKGCKATVVTISDVISSSSGQHLHDPSDTRVAVTDANQTNHKTTPKTSSKVSLIHKQSLVTISSPNSLKQQRDYDICGHFSNQKKLKTYSNRKSFINSIINTTNSDNDVEIPNNEISLPTEVKVEAEEYEESIDCFVDHLNVEIEVDESGKVRLEDTDDDNDNDIVSSPELSTTKCLQQNMLQLMPNRDIKPNNIYFTNNYTNIEYFDIEMNNLFEVVRQSGFNSLDIDQISNDWELWKNRYLELKRARNRSKQSTSNGSDKEGENLRVELKTVTNAKQNVERELKRTQNSLKVSQNNVLALQAALRRNILNTSNNQCIALLNEINDLKRKVSAQVESHQSNLNEVKRLLCLDDDDLRAEFDQLAQERDDALNDNHSLRQQVISLENKMSSYENKSE